MDAAIFRTISGVKGTTAKPGLAGFVKVDIALTVMDPLINQATFSVVATPGSVERYPYGIMDRKRVALNLPKSVSLVTDIQSAIGTSGKLEIKRGDSSIAKKADMPAIPIK